MTMLTAASRIHADDRVGAEANGMVDLALLAGRTIRMSQEAACELFGTTRPTMRKMIELGLVRKGGLVGDGAVATTRWILLDPADTRRSLYERWTGQLGTPRTHRDFDEYMRVRDVCLIPGREMPQANIVDGMLPRLLQIGAHHTAEFGAFTPTHPESHPELRALIWKDGVQRVPRDRWRDDIRPTDEMVLEAAPGLRHAPGTIFEGLLGGEDLGRPKDQALRSAWRMGPLRQAALLWAHVAAASYRRAGAVRTGLRKLRTLDEILERYVPEGTVTEGGQIAAALDHLAFSPDVRLSRHARFTACRDAMVIMRQVQLYARMNDPDGSRGIAAMAPPTHPDRLGFTARLQERYKDLPAIGRANRKRSSDRAAAQYERLCEIADLRLEQVVATQEAAAASAKRLLATDPGDPSSTAKWLLATKAGAAAGAARRLLAKGTHEAAEEARHVLSKAVQAAGVDAISGRTVPLPFADFPVEITIMTPKGELLPGSQACHWRAWRERDLWLDLAARRKWLTSIEDEQLIIHLREIAADPNAYPDVVFESRGCTPLHGDQAIEPWFVTISNMGVMTAPGSMTVRQRRRRHQHMITWSLPAYNGSAEGLLNYDKSHGMLWRWANDRNRNVVPLAQFALAMRFVHLGFSIADETMCRLGELLQIRQDADALPIDRSTGKAEPTFLAIPKTSAIEPELTEVRFPISQELLVHATKLADDVARLNGHADGVLPEIAPARELSDRRQEVAAWIFQHNGRALHGAEMNRFLAFLFANVIDITFHDIRHASANASREAGTPEESVQALLNHRKRSTAQYYMRGGRRQRRVAHVAGVRRRKERAAVTLALRGEPADAIKV